jgi:uncharacterized membrane protein YfcA
VGELNAMIGRLFGAGGSLFVIGVLAGSAGVGGGGLNVPVLIFVLGVPISEAVVLSHIAVLGNIIAQNAVNLPRRHPTRDAPLIDFTAPLLLLPAQLSGNAIGLSLRTLFPPGGLIVLCTAVLLLISRKVAIKAREMGVHERASRIDTASLRECLLAIPPLAPQVSEDTRKPWQLQVPWRHLLALSAFLAVFLVDLLALGGTLKLPLVRRAEHCSPEYWTFTLATIPIGALAVAYGLTVSRRAGGAERVPRPSLEEVVPELVASSDHPDWADGNAPQDREQLGRGHGADADGVSVNVLPLAAGCVGIFSGLLGLGGGEVLAPLCLTLGMPTDVAAATSSFIILFSELSNVVHYAVEGVLTDLVDLGLMLAACACAGAVLGRLISILAVRAGRRSVSVLLLSVLLGLSALLLMVRAISTGMLGGGGGDGDESPWAFGPLCVPHAPAGER